MVFRETIKDLGNIAKETGTKLLSYSDYITYILIYGGIPLVIYLIYKHIKINYNDFYTKYLDFKKKSYVKIIMTDNKKLINKIVPLTEFNTFNLNKKTFALADIENFVIGYQKGIPVFLYDGNFILPLTFTNEKLNKTIINQLQIKKTDKNYKETISAITMKLSPEILHLVYDKKLLSDMYKSGDSTGLNLDSPVVKWGLVAMGVYLAYVTGLLDKLMVMFNGG